MLTYANDSLTYRLPDRIKIIGLGKIFDDWVSQVPLKMHKNTLDLTDFCYLPRLNSKFSILKYVNDM